MSKSRNARSETNSDTTNEATCTYNDQQWWFYISGEEMVIKTRWPNRKNRVSYRSKIPLDMSKATDEDIYDEVMNEIMRISFEH